MLIIWPLHAKSCNAHHEERGGHEEKEEKPCLTRGR